MEPELRHLVVPRTARYATLGSLEGPVEEVWFLLHGYGQLSLEFIGHARALQAERRLLVAPEGLSRFYHEDHKQVGASWMTREDRDAEIEDYVRYLDLLYERIADALPSFRVHLRVLGFSQGVATATRWAIRGRAPIRSLVLWGSPLPAEQHDGQAIARLGGMAITLVGGTRDSFLTEEHWREQTTLLARHRLPFEVFRFEGGHRLDDDTLRALTS